MIRGFLKTEMAAICLAKAPQLMVNYIQLQMPKPQLPSVARADASSERDQADSERKPKNLSSS